MWKHTIATLFWVGSGLLAACASQPSVTPPETWEVRLIQSGGIAAFWLSVEVSSDGRLAAEDRRLGKSVQETLPEEVVTRLSQLITATHVSSVRTAPTRCADCFLYDLEIRINGTITRVSADDISLKDSGAAELIEFLRQLRDEALGREAGMLKMDGSNPAV